MSSSKVHGMMALRDEWPLCAVSICHALEHHVDDLVVLDHGSELTTSAGLETLAHRYGERLTVLRLDGLPFWQAEITTEILLRIDAAPDDWLYVLDADEFLISQDDRSLGEVLASLPSTVTSVRYEVDNWVAPEDFDEQSWDSFRAITARSIPAAFTSSFPLLARDITDGRVNFFDVPFASKVIFRRRSFGGFPVGGSHYFTPAEGIRVREVRPETLRLAHLPLLTRRRLDARAARRPFATMTKPKFEGWQVPIFIDVADSEGLDDFWSRHSIGAGARPPGATPTIVADQRLAAALDEVLTSLDSTSIDQAMPGESAIISTRPVPEDWIESIRRRRVDNVAKIEAWATSSARRDDDTLEQWRRWERDLPDLDAGPEGFFVGRSPQPPGHARRLRARRWITSTPRRLLRPFLTRRR